MGLSIDSAGTVNAVETLTPLGDLVVLRAIDPSKTSKGGLVMPDTFKPRQPRAEVIAVGEGRMLDCGRRNELKVKPGDVVILNGPVHALELEGQDKMMLCEYGQIVGIIN